MDFEILAFLSYSCVYFMYICIPWSCTQNLYTPDLFPIVMENLGNCCCDSILRLTFVSICTELLLL